jgi:hypothetical protein
MRNLIPVRGYLKALASTPTSGPLGYPLELSGCPCLPGIAGNDEDGHTIFHETPQQVLAVQRRGSLVSAGGIQCSLYMSWSALPPSFTLNFCIFFGRWLLKFSGDS